MERQPRQRGVQAKIVEYLANHPNKDFSTESIALGAELTLPQVKNAMSKLVQQGSVAIGPVRGLYHYNGGAVDHRVGRGTMMEVLKVRPNGEVIEIDENGDFWVARKVEM